MYLTILIISLTLLSYLALIAALVIKYLRTRDQGFVWLGAAVVIWPIAARLLDRVVIHRLVIAKSIQTWTLLGEPLTIGGLLSLLYLIQDLVAVVLLLIAISRLCRAHPLRELP